MWPMIATSKPSSATTRAQIADDARLRRRHRPDVDELLDVDRPRLGHAAPVLSLDRSVSRADDQGDLTDAGDAPLQPVPGLRPARRPPVSR